MRQVGLVTLSKGTSLNRPEDDKEARERQSLLNKVVDLGNKMKYMKSWKIAWQGLKKMRMYTCWSAGPLLQNTGLLLLNLLQSSEGPKMFGGGNETLLREMEAFASSIRYTEGTWMERKKLGEYPSWTRHAPALRTSRGLPEVAPPNGWDERVPLPCGGWLDPRTPSMAEAQSRCRGADADATPTPAPRGKPKTTPAPTPRGGAQAKPQPTPDVRSQPSPRSAKPSPTPQAGKGSPRPTPPPPPSPPPPPPPRKGKGGGSPSRRRL